MILPNYFYVFLATWIIWLEGVRSYTIITSTPQRATQKYPSSLKATEHLPDSASPSSYLATCIPGLAPCLASELESIHPDITDIALSGNAAVTFTATREASLNILCWTRTAHRLLELVAATYPEQDGLLYDKNDIHSFINQSVDVKSLLGDGKGGLLTLSVKAILNNPRGLPKDLSHSHYTALSIKNALCDIVRDLRGDRPDVDIDDPDVPLVVMLRGDNGGASISLYRSLHPPGSLHKRGYRQGPIHKAAMKESLAAGLLLEAGWKDRIQQAKEEENPNDKKLCVIDPMAGSGSLLLEAAMMAADISPGLMRIRCQVPGQNMPPVTRWKSDLDTAKMWKEVLLDASKRAKNGLAWMKSEASPTIVLRANDIHPGAVDILEDSADAAGLLGLIDVTNMDCYDLEMKGFDDCFVVTNPPWGVRLTDDIASSWEGLRHFLRDVCPENTEAWILSGHKAATATLKLRRNKMVPIQTGDQNLRWIQYIISSKEEKRKINKDGKQKASTPSRGQEVDSW